MFSRKCPQIGPKMLPKSTIAVENTRPLKKLQPSIFLLSRCMREKSRAQAITATIASNAASRKKRTAQRNQNSSFVAPNAFEMTACGSFLFSRLCLGIAFGNKKSLAAETARTKKVQNAIPATRLPDKRSGSEGCLPAE